MTARTTLAVCICTYRRPDALARLLGLLAESAADVADLAAVGVAVVDDDPAGSAAEVAESFQGRFELGLGYAVTGSGNISTARNRALDEGSAVGAWLALIDDDCTPGPGWLRGLVEGQRRHDADAVSGRCIAVAAAGAPAWLAEEGLVGDEQSHADGDRLAEGPLKNTLVSARFLADHGLRFDPGWGVIGGEDTMFFLAANAAGMHHRYADAAVVSEELPIERCTYRYQLGRHLWIGNISAHTLRAGTGRPTWLLLAGGLKLVARAVGGFAGALATERRLRWRRLTFGLATGTGRLLGSVGVRVRHH